MAPISEAMMGPASCDVRTAMENEDPALDRMREYDDWLCGIIQPVLFDVRDHSL